MARGTTYRYENATITIAGVRMGGVAEVTYRERSPDWVDAFELVELGWALRQTELRAAAPIVLDWLIRRARRGA